MWLASTSATPTFFLTKPEVFARSRSAMISAYLAPRNHLPHPSKTMGRTCLCRVLPCLRYMGPRYHSNWGSPGRIEAQCTTASLASPEDPGANGRLEPELSKTFLQIAKCENVKRDYFALFEELTIPLST